MSDFQTAVNLVLNHEGGFTPGLAGDSGGATNWGISLRWHPELGLDGIKNLSREQASGIYQKEYWSPAMEQEPDQRMGNAMLDTAVSQGPAVAAELYQQFGHSIKEYQLARLLRYAALNKPQFNHSWFERCLDV
jgi:lysozyme family protein